MNHCPQGNGQARVIQCGCCGLSMRNSCFDDHLETHKICQNFYKCNAKPTFRDRSSECNCQNHALQFTGKFEINLVLIKPKAFYKKLAQKSSNVL